MQILIKLVEITKTRFAKLEECAIQTKKMMVVLFAEAQKRFQTLNVCNTKN
jgi:hypothetical protein